MMSLCTACGLSREDGRELCAQHDYSVADDWATGNRILCDWFHRGIVPTRLDPALREDEPVPAA